MCVPFLVSVFDENGTLAPAVPTRNEPPVVAPPSTTPPSNPTIVEDDQPAIDDEDTADDDQTDTDNEDTADDDQTDTDNEDTAGDDQTDTDDEDTADDDQTDTDDENTAGDDQTDTDDENTAGGDQTDTDDENTADDDQTDTDDENTADDDQTDTDDEDTAGDDQTDTDDEDTAGDDQTDTDDENTAGDDQTDTTTNSSGSAQPIEQNMTVLGGRVTTIDTTLENVASIEITMKPEVGNLTVNPDNTLALVLSGTDHSGPLSFQYTATFEDGTSQNFDYTVDVAPLQQLQGWATGESIYMLETDEDDNLIIEHGDNHRVVHVSKSDKALTKSDLAALEGFDAAEIRDKTLQNLLLEKSEYGSTSDMALDEELGAILWRGLTELSDTPGSHWLLLERGFEYDEQYMWQGTKGESELHPIYIGSYGNGAPPLFLDGQNLSAEPSSNVVVQNVAFTNGMSIFNSQNVLLDNLVFDGGGLTAQGANGRVEGFTIRDSTIHDVVRDEPEGDAWSTADRISGLFVRQTDGLLIEGVHVDQSGWEDDYDYFGDPAYGQAPNSQSQNIYLQKNISDITFRDNITMRAAGTGAQIRSGGFVEDNVFLDSNTAVLAAGGPHINADVGEGHFSLLADNLVTSGGGKEVYQAQGALTWGITLTEGNHTALLDNIVAHLADPNNPIEFAEKLGTPRALLGEGPYYYDDTIVYNWKSYNKPDAPDRNTEGLDTGLADQTTIQLFTADLLGTDNATIDDLGEFLRTQAADGKIDAVTADDIIAYFQENFGIAPDIRTEAETLRFVPNDIGDGVRWDNRINWTTEDLPGTVDGDSVDLGGNWVTFGTMTGTVEDLEFGSGGRLAVTSGRLNVEGETTAGEDGAEIDVKNSGQLWMEDYRDGDELDIDIEGGRFANQGFFEGLLDIHVTDGQVLLGVDDAVMELNNGSRLTIEGDEAKVGFDGEAGGVSVLRMEAGSELRMIADDTGFSTIEEFRSGALETENDEPDVLSAFDMGEGTLLIDVTAIAGGDAREEVLVETDEIVGMFDGVEFVGLGDDQDATLTVDYENDKVTVSLGTAKSGTGEVNIATVGSMMNNMDDAEIWNALTEGKDTYLEDAEEAPVPSKSDTLEDDDHDAAAA